MNFLLIGQQMNEKLRSNDTPAVVHGVLSHNLYRAAPPFGEGQFARQFVAVGHLSVLQFHYGRPHGAVSHPHFVNGDSSHLVCRCPAFRGAFPAECVSMRASFLCFLRCCLVRIPPFQPFRRHHLRAYCRLPAGCL